MCFHYHRSGFHGLEMVLHRLTRALQPWNEIKFSVTPAYSKHLQTRDELPFIPRSWLDLARRVGSADRSHSIANGTAPYDIFASAPLSKTVQSCRTSQIAPRSTVIARSETAAEHHVDMATFEKRLRSARIQISGNISPSETRLVADVT